MSLHTALRLLVLVGIGSVVVIGGVVYLIERIVTRESEWNRDGI